MSQAWSMPVSTDQLSSAVQTKIPDALGALRSCFAGATEPSTTEAYMVWVDTSNGQVKRRNAANSAWVIEGSILKDVGKTRMMVGEFASVAATFTTFVAPCLEAGQIKRVILVSTTASSSSSGNEWQFALQNKTQAVALFSGTVGTDTALGGVGGGEIAVDTEYVLTPDQNQALAAGDVLEFTMTKVGTVTTLTRLLVLVEFTQSEE